MKFRVLLPEVNGENVSYLNECPYCCMTAMGRAEMNTLSGRKGAGCAEIPSPDELDALKAAAASAPEAKLR